MRAPTRPPSPAEEWRTLQRLKHGVEPASCDVGQVLLVLPRSGRERLRVSLHRRRGAPTIEIALDVLTSDGGWMRTRRVPAIRLSEAAAIADVLASVAPVRTARALATRSG